MTKGEEEFIDQMTRKHMARWAEMAAMNGDGTAPLGDGSMKDGGDDPFIQHAVTKKWISPVDGPCTGYRTYKILSAGWDTASRFLKR